MTNLDDSAGPVRIRGMDLEVTRTLAVLFPPHPLIGRSGLLCLWEGAFLATTIGVVTKWQLACKKEPER